MTILIVSLLNVIFVIIAYISLSSKMKKMVENKPEGLDDDINGLIHEFNNVADMNISLLDDRLKTVKIQTDKAERVGQEIEGLINRYQLLRKDDVKTVKKKPKKNATTKKTEKNTKKKAPKVADKIALKKNLKAYNDNVSRENTAQPELNTQNIAAESLESLVEKGLAADEIAEKLGVARGEIDLRLRILKLKNS